LLTWESVNLFTGKTCTGLDIGSQSIKLVQVRRRGRRVLLQTLGQIATPSGTVENGFINDPDLVGRELGKLVNRLKLRGAKVISALGGKQVYTRLLTLPAMNLDDMRRAAFYQAASFLPISIDDVTVDIFPVRYLDNNGSRKCQVFFTAARKVQVENLVHTCQAAGLKLERLEIEPLALHTLYYGLLKDGQAVGVLNIGSNHSYLAVYQNKTLVFVRLMSFGCTAFYQHMRESGTDCRKLADLSCREAGIERVMENLVSELNQAMDYFRLQSRNTALSFIILCGGGARVGDMEDFLSQETGIPVKVGDFPSQVQLPDSLACDKKNDLLYEYPVALGLAMRG